MTRAEEAALKAYPQVWNEEEDCDINYDGRHGFIEGYEQAEKDLALTWKDIQRIITVNEIYSCEMIHPPYKSKEYCEEVLRRFNEEKEERK